MKATFKVRVIDDPTPPVPPFVGTTLSVNITEAGQKFAIVGAHLAEGHESFTYDWGDGVRQVFTANTQSVVHEYAASGTYRIRISDDIDYLIVTSSTGNPEPLVAAESNAQALHTFGPQTFARCANLRRLDFGSSALESIGLRAFRDCSSLAGELYFPHVRELAGTATAQPFVNCTGGVTKIHFSEGHRAEIEASQPYIGDPTLGTGTAEVVFDS